MKKSPPPKLYKYQPYNSQTLDNLRNCRIWLSKPIKFNDPFDCATNFKISSHTAKDWKALYKKYKKVIDKKEEFDLKYITKGHVNKAFKDSAMSGLIDAIQEKVDETRNQNGVACFSEVVDNILMWAHYADGHRGFCLEFDTKNEPFSQAFPVVYSNFVPILNMADILIRNLTDKLLELVTTKASLWSYEEEWRVIHNKGNKAYGVAKETLTGLYFGTEMPLAHKEEIFQILNGSSTKLYEMQKVDGEFKVTFRPFEYASHTQVIRKGDLL